MSTNDFQPDVPVVLSEEIPYGGGTEPPVNVRQIGPVRTQELPHKAGATFTKVGIGVAPAIRLLTADHRRARVTLISTSAFQVAYSNASSQDASRMALWPANVPLTLFTDSEVWVCAPTGTVTISALVEVWAAGEDGVS